MAQHSPDVTPQPATRWAKWPSIGFMALLVGGLCLAAWQAVHRSPDETQRDLTILAPVGAGLTLDGVESRIPVAEGVHAFSVRPGPAALEVKVPDGPSLSRTLAIPAGYGPLMIEVTPGPGGKLLIGYF